MVSRTAVVKPAASRSIELRSAMKPIHEVLSRIRWDPDFARAEFALGYFDRVEGRIMLVPFREIDFPQDDPEVFRLMDAEGRTHRVPFHRVREVYRNGARIWHRPATAILGAFPAR